MEIVYMKKAILSIFVLLLSITPAIADTMAVQAVTTISTETPENIIKVRVMRDCKLDNVELKIGYILEGKMLSVTDPKRLKRDASFTFFPMSYTDLNGNTTHISTLYVGTFSPKFEIDAKQLAKNTALSVGNHFISGLSMGYRAVEGAVTNNQGNALKSAANNVYEHSFVSYVEKGEQINIKPETCFGLKFKECENAPKEEHKIED